MSAMGNLLWILIVVVFLGWYAYSTDTEFIRAKAERFKRGDIGITQIFWTTCEERFELNAKRIPRSCMNKLIVRKNRP